MTTDWATLRGLLIDLDGVVYTGRDPILGAASFLAEARRRGLRATLVLAGLIALKWAIGLAFLR